METYFKQQDEFLAEMISAYENNLLGKEYEPYFAWKKGSQLFVADSLRTLGFNPSGEYYLGFEIKSLKPIEIDGLDIAALNLYGKGDESYRPYFTTLKELRNG